MTDLRTDLGEAVAAAFAAEGVDASVARVTASDRPDLADFQSNGALAAAKALKANPRELAGRVAERLAADPRLSGVEVAGPGFINLKVADAALARRAQGVADDAALAGASKVAEARKVVIDYAGPNVAKPMHVGHLRSSIIGESLKRLFRFRGDTVWGDAHFGDWGFQMGLADRGRGRRGRGRRFPGRGRGTVPRPQSGDAGRPRAPLSDGRRQGQGRHRLPRPRPQGDGGAAGRTPGLPRPVAAFRGGLEDGAGTGVRGPGRHLRPVERGVGRRSPGPRHGRRDQGQGPRRIRPGRLDHPGGRGGREARAAAAAAGLVGRLGHVRHDGPGDDPGSAPAVRLRSGPVLRRRASGRPFRAGLPGTPTRSAMRRRGSWNTPPTAR